MQKVRGAIYVKNTKKAVIAFGLTGLAIGAPGMGEVEAA